MRTVALIGALAGMATIAFAGTTARLTIGGTVAPAVRVVVTNSTVSARGNTSFAVSSVQTPGTLTCTVTSKE